MMSFKLDSRAFESALRKFARDSKKSADQVLKDEARRFVREVALVTPPNQGGKMQKSRGTSAVRGDIKKIMAPTRRKTKVDPWEVHRKFRNQRGRIGREFEKKRKYHINTAALREFVRKKTERVGFLAAGWNSAAQRLGTRLPNWITKHGSKNGSIRVVLNAMNMTISVVNSVPFIGNVADLRRRVQHALNVREGKLRRQTEDYAIKKAARRAGFKVR